jgi:hypothetical protein
MCLDSHSSDFNHHHLESKGEDHNSDEEEVVENSREDIELVSLELSSIDLVEKLKEDKDLEHKGVMEEFLSLIPLLEITREAQVGGVSEDSVSAKRELAVLLLVFLADHLVESIFVEVILGEAFGRPPFDGVFVLVDMISEEWVPFNAINTSIVVCIAFGPVVSAQPSWGSEDQEDKSNNLVDGMSKNISPHNLGNDCVILLIWLSQ